MLKFRNIALLSCVFGTLFASNLLKRGSSRDDIPCSSKQVHLEQHVLSDNSLGEYSVNNVPAQLDESSSNNVSDIHDQDYSQGSDPTLIVVPNTVAYSTDDELSSSGRNSLGSTDENLSTESTITSEDSIQDKVALILEKIPTQGVKAFGDTSDYDIINQVLAAGAFDILRYDYYSEHKILDELSDLLRHSELYREILFLFVFSAHCFAYDANYPHSDVEKIQEEFKRYGLIIPLD